jgi:hypothetical protein
VSAGSADTKRREGRKEKNKKDTPRYSLRLTTQSLARATSANTQPICAERHSIQCKRHELSVDARQALQTQGIWAALAVSRQ